MSSVRQRAWISPAIDAFALDVQQRAVFTLRFFAEVVRGPFHPTEVVRQCYHVGYRSLPLVLLTGFVTGIVFTKQSRPSLAEFGATSWLPSLITIAIVRSLAPLVTALVCAGRVGSSIGAELGSMKVTEQVDAMEVSGINPYKYLVVTRTLATTTMTPVLATFCGFVGLIGAYIDVHAREATSLSTFIVNGFGAISYLDLGAAVTRCFVFGFTVGIVSCYEGLHSSGGGRGVGVAANTSVVLSMFAIFVEEILIVQAIQWMRG
jgi:phospholipid/cholesterol/gamma-HCH transport system permease protein